MIKISLTYLNINQRRCHTIQVFNEGQDLQDKLSFQQASSQKEELQVGKELIWVQVKIVVGCRLQGSAQSLEKVSYGCRVI